MKRFLSWLPIMALTAGCFPANNKESDAQDSENAIPIYGTEYRDDCVMTDSNVEVTQYQPPVHDNHGLECYVNRQEQIIAEAPFSAANHMEDLGYMVCTEKEFELLDSDPCMSTSTQGLTSEDTFALTVVDCENESGCQAQPVGLRVIDVDPPSDDGLPPLPDRLERIQNSWGYITIKAAEHNGYGGAYAPGDEVYFPSTAGEYRGGAELLPPEGEVIFNIEFDDENGQDFFDALRESTDLSDRQTLIETRRAEVTNQHLEFLSLRGSTPARVPRSHHRRQWVG